MSRWNKESHSMLGWTKADWAGSGTFLISMISDVYKLYYICMYNLYIYVYTLFFYPIFLWFCYAVERVQKR